MNAPQLLRGDAALALLAGDVDLDQHLGLRLAVASELLERRVGGDRVDQAAERQQLLDLAALQVADEVPLEGVAPALALGGQVLLAVLADQRHPGLGQRAHLLDRHVLGRGEDLDPVAGALAHPLQVGARSSPARGRGSGPALSPPASSQTRPRLAPGAPAVAAVGEEELRLAAGAEPGDLDLARPRPRAAAAAPPRPGRASGPAAIPSPSCRRRRRAPRRRPRSSRGRSRGRSRRAVALDRRGAAGDDPGGEAAPAAVQHRHPAGAGEGDGQAVGDEDQRARPGSATTWPSTSGGSLGRGERLRPLRAEWDAQLGAVDLAADRDPLGREAERSGEPPRFSSTASARRR